MKNLSSLFLFSVLLAVSVGCSNPLAGEKAGTTSGATYFPGLPDLKPDHLVVVSGDSQTNLIGTAITATVKVVDAKSKVVPNVSLTLSILSGGGQVASSVTTDSNGEATISWTLGNTTGTQSFRISGSNFTGSPATLDLTASAYQNFTLSIPFTSGTESSYLFNDLTYAGSMLIDLSGNKVRLKPADQTDDVNNTFTGSTQVGTQWEPGASYNFIRLNTATNNSELDASWTPQWSSLVGYWKMDNNFTNSASASYNGANPTGYTFQTNQKIGSHGVSVSSGFIDFGNVTQLNQVQKYTLSMWLKATATNSDFATICSKHVNASTRIALQYGAAGYGTSAALFTAMDNVNGRHTTRPHMTTGTWNHVFLVYDGTQATNAARLIFYINGEQVPMTIGADAIPVTNANLGGANFRCAVGTSVMDDLALWSTALTGPEINMIYNRQSAKYAGQVTSKIMDAYSAQPWSSLAARTTLPFYKELPGDSNSSGTITAADSETNSSTTGYSDISANLMNGLAGLWHFSETSGTTVADSSGAGNTGTKSGTATLGVTSLFGTGVLGGSGYFTSGTIMPFTGNAAYSTSMWIKTTTTGVFNNLFIRRAADMNGQQGWLVYIHNTTGLAYFRRIYNGTETGPASTSRVNDGHWHHILGTYDGTASRLYIDGKLNGTAVTDSNPIIDTGGTFRFGLESGTSDETAIWSRALSDDEVKQVYRRGANRIKYQVRVCDTVNCANEEASVATGKGWKGPDNTRYSYFSELSNNTVVNTTSGDGTGVVKIAPLDLSFATFSGVPFSLTNRQWFQYRAVFETDDTNTLCNYGAAASCSPELKSVTIGPDHYTTTVQTITSKASIGSTYYQLDANGFSTPAPVGTCSEVALYTVSKDGTLFYYWNGSAWTLSSNTYATASTAAQITSNISTFPTAVGTGTLQVKTFLKSTGLSPCEVDTLQFTGKKF